MEDLQWFLNRVGRTVYVDNPCDCEVCKTHEKDGIFITDKEAATYLHTVQSDIYHDSGVDMNFRDTF